MNTGSPSPPSLPLPTAGDQAPSSSSGSSTPTRSRSAFSASRQPKPPKVLQLPLDQIEPPALILREHIDHTQIQALAHSMARLGLLNPIRVRKVNDHYRIVAGHRRYLAAQHLRWLSIAAIPSDGPGGADLETSAHENLFREDLTPIEEAALVSHLCDDEGMNYDQAAAALNHSPDWIQGRRALLDYPPDLQQAIHDNTVPLVAAPHLAQIDDPAYRANALDGARTHGMTARAAMEWARQYELYKAMKARGADPALPTVELVSAEAAKTPCDVCTNLVYINTTKLIRICFDCLQAFKEAMRSG